MHEIEVTDLNTLLVRKTVQPEFGVKLISADGRCLKLTEAGKHFTWQTKPLLSKRLNLSLTMATQKNAAHTFTDKQDVSFQAF